MATSAAQKLCGIHRAGRTWAVLILAAGVLLAGVASGPGSAHATSVGAKARAVSPAWTSPAGVPEAATNGGSPALATYKGSLYAVWQGSSSPYAIFYSAYDGATSTWTPPATVPGALTNYRTGPAAAVYDGKLYVAWQGQSTPFHVWYAAFNGTSWSAQAEVPAALVHISSTVGLASFGGRLYVAWTGESSPYAVWYASFNGTSWSAQAKIPGTSSDNFQATDTPLASYGGDLYVSWETGAGNTLEYATFNGSTWSSPGLVGATSDAGPALAVKGTKLYESWINYSTLAVDYASFDGTSWSAVKAIPGASIFIELGPAVAGYNGNLYVAWAPNSSPSAIEYSIGV
jgi:hypothetical protein